MYIPVDLAARMRQALAEFATRATPAEQKQVLQRIEQAHHQVLAARETPGPAPHPRRRLPINYTPIKVQHPELALVWSALRGSTQELERAPETLSVVDANGVIIGRGKYETLDPGWVIAAVAWLDYFHKVVPWPEVAAPTIPIPDDTTVALLGDWGTGDWRDASNPSPSTRVANAMSSYNPDYAIHLGDVYYAGLPEDNLTRFQASEGPNFLDVWPGATRGSFALNSNHDMYPGGVGYFQEALVDPMFSQQKGSSYFALENSHWIILGLDSAYYANAATLYDEGRLDTEAQLPYIAKAAATGKKLILLTHHNGLAQDGKSTTRIWDQVVGQTMGASGVLWYWGHVHAGVAYAPKNGIYARCVGHSAIPWGDSSALANNSNVEWYENQNAQDPDVPERVMNGFALLKFQGASMTEQFIDENGNGRWSHTF